MAEVRKPQKLGRQIRSVPQTKKLSPRNQLSGSGRRVSQRQELGEIVKCAMDYNFWIF